MTPPEETSFLGVPLVGTRGVYARAVREVFAPLDTTGARLLGGRFNPPGVSALYLAKDPDLALRESTRSLDWAGFTGFAPRVVISVRVRLSRVVDLSNPLNVAAVGLTEDALFGEWVAAADLSPTQVLGDLAARAGVEAIKFPSRIDHNASNLAVFPDNLAAASSLEIVLEDGPLSST